MQFDFEPPHRFAVLVHGQSIIEHTREQPLFHVGLCESSYPMHLGHFFVEHRVHSKVSLQLDAIEELIPLQVYRLVLVDSNQSQRLELKLTLTDQKLQLDFPASTSSNYIRSVLEDDHPIERDGNSVDDHDRRHLWFSFDALPFAEETVHGAGLQFGSGDLRGQVLPIWVSEWYHDQLHAHDDGRPRPPDHTSYHPQPMFVSSRGYTFCAYGSAYAQFDFRDEKSHEMHFAALPYRLEWTLNGFSSPCPLYPPLPQWLHDGIILSVQGGTQTIETKLRTMHEHETRIAGVWAQDWCGKRVTSFGKRVFWNWQWNPSWYPDLKEKIVQWKSDFQGCRFLVYINPYIAVDGSLFDEANRRDFLVKHLSPDDSVYLIDFGEFNGAIVDLTNPQAFDWYKTVIRSNLLDLGVSGWMADFGEYLPCDVRVHANISGPLIHNLWPVLWARCNHEAIRDAGKLDEIVFFMRSGYLNVQRFCPLFWAGDQCVNFSARAGLPAGIRSSLSLALSDVLSVHTDIGGYFGRQVGRDRELLLRWCEMAAFNVAMRTHEGNRPAENVQFDSDDICIEFFARMSRIHLQLKPYARHVVQQAHQLRRSCVTRHTDLQFFFGDDLLVAPVTDTGVNQWNVSIPAGQWIHLWTGATFDNDDDDNDDDGGSEVNIGAPLGSPPVFYRSTSEWKTLFEQFNRVDNN